MGLTYGVGGSRTKVPSSGHPQGAFPPLVSGTSSKLRNTPGFEATCPGVIHKNKHKACLPHQLWGALGVVESVSPGTGVEKG